MRPFYLRFRVHVIQKWPFSGTYPLIYSTLKKWTKNILTNEFKINGYEKIIQ